MCAHFNRSIPVRKNDRTKNRVGTLLGRTINTLLLSCPGSGVGVRRCVRSAATGRWNGVGSRTVSPAAADHHRQPETLESRRTAISVPVRDGRRLVISDVPRAAQRHGFPTSLHFVRLDAAPRVSGVVPRIAVNKPRVFPRTDATPFRSGKRIFFFKSSSNTAIRRPPRRIRSNNARTLRLFLKRQQASRNHRFPCAF